MNKILLLFISLFLSTNVFSFEDDETKYLKLKYEWFGQINDSLKIRIRTTSTNFQINWNPLDGGEFENVTLIHKDGLKYIEKEFDSSDDREIWIRGDEYSFWFSNKENKTINKYKNNYFKLVDVLNWGNGKWSNFKETFQYCYYLRTFTADDKPDLSKAITMERAFDNAMVFNADIADWDVSNVNCFNRTFSNTKKFNSDLSKWLFAPKNYGITIDSMFYNARKFDSDISDWNYTHINKVDNLFLGATSIRPVKVLDVLVAITAAHKEKNHIKTLSSLFNFSVDLAIPNYSGLLFYSSWNKKEVDSTNTIPKVIANPSITVLKGEIIQLTDNVLRYFDDEGDSMGGLQFYIPSEGINEIGNDQIWIDLNDNNVADENDLRYNDLKRLNGGDIITVDNTDELRFNFSQKETIRLNYKITDITAYDDESDFSQLTINVVDDLPSIIYFQQELVKCKEKDESYLLPIHVKLSEVSGEDIKFKIKNYGSVSEIESEIAESEYCIPAGKKEISFNVTIKADEIEEDTKSVFFYFDNIINANCGVSNSVMELRIMDDDLKPTVIRKSWAMPSNLHKGNIVGCIDYADDNTKDNVNFRLESDPEGVINIDGYGIIRLITERKLKYSYKINSGGSGGFFSMKPNGFGFVDDNYKFFSFSVIDGVENHETVINSTLVVRPPYTTPALNTKIIIVREDKKEIPKIDTSGFDGFKIKLKEEDSIFYFEDNELKIKEDAELEYRDKKSYKFDYYLSNSVCFSDKVIRSVSSYYSARGIFSNIVINIESINTPPSILNTKLKFKENSSFVGEIEYEDIDDPAANISFSLSGEDKDLFKIDGHELKLVDAEGFDFENDKHVYSVKLKAFDTESYSEEMEISLRLEDADEPAVIKSVSFVVNENESNIVVGTIDYDDPENKELKFDLLNNIDLFDISHNNIIKLKMDVKLDYEKQALYNLNIKSNETDAKEFSIIINVLDVPEAPQIITENINVKDGEFLISEIQAFDPEGDNFVFSVVANDEYSCVGDIIISKSKLHYHSAGSNSYSIKISATETKATNPKSTEKDITIHIVNTLEFSSITSTVFEISETIGDISETYIGDIQYTNPENLASINYNLVSNSEKFEIRDNKLYLKLGEALDYEDTSSYVLKLKSEEIG
ncbi:MAG: BspA family leucine-rich repeat surface protein, partial [Marinifilaceae bacterium]|nr:BspA family leucine-rich repeat surface protein [Marinifilaceae bacterium]